MELFTAWLGAESAPTMNIEASYRVSPRKASCKFPSEVLVKFLDLSVKIRILE